MRSTVLVCLTLLWTAAACSDSTSSGGSGGHTTSISVSDNVFQPSEDTVAAGQTVTWTWTGANGHNVTFETLPDTSATMSSGAHQVNFSAPGTYRYRCTVHSAAFGSGMHGTIVVQ
jgi:plastocyanin